MAKIKATATTSPSDDVYCWLEQNSSVMLKAVTSFGDPVELTASDAKAIALMLLALADQLEPQGESVL
jgi:hypothetical protein